MAVSFGVYGCGKPWIAEDLSVTLIFYPKLPQHEKTIIKQHCAIAICDFNDTLSIKL